MQRAGVPAEDEGRKFHQPPGDEQRHSGGNRETGLADWFQRGLFRGTAAKQYLQSARLPMPRNRELPVERPIFVGCAGKWLEKERGPTGIQIVRGKKLSRRI
jgi:hypothetical protein